MPGLIAVKFICKYSACMESQTHYTFIVQLAQSFTTPLWFFLVFSIGPDGNVNLPT